MKICLDAGHYGKYNQSPVNKAYWESEFTWKFHLLLKAELERYGVEVITTRADQAKDLALISRGKKAQGCDLFLSIHSNACNSESADHPLACCCISGKCDVLGLQIAQTVQRVMGCKQPGRITKKKGDHGNYDWYSVLHGASQVGVPGILMEHGFHTNRANTEWLLNDANLKRLAEAEAETIADYYGLTKQPGGTSAPEPSAPAAATGEGFLIKVVCAELNVRRGVGTGFPIATVVHKGEVFTITETCKAPDGGLWGHLKSGAGWINVGSAYCKRI